MVPLPPNEVHLWFAEPERITDQRLLSQYAQLLDEEEVRRHRRFYFERHRHQFLVSHALVRVTLSRYAAIAASAWTFSKNCYGRPDIDLPGAPPLVFNLSHTDGLAVCGIVRERDLGVDVEDTQRRGKTIEIAESFFSALEVRQLRQARPGPAQRSRFFDYWTLKESYIKARGMGLSLPLDQFSFDLEHASRIRITLDPRINDDPSSWQFALFSPNARHRAALAVRRGPSAPLAIRAWLTVPLSNESHPLAITGGEA